MGEIYVSTDVEADGPIPGPHSMLSFASAAYREDKTLVATFSANLATLPDAEPHPATMAWWAAHPEAWTACRKDPQDPAVALRAYAGWLEGLPGTPVFVGYPASYDFLFVYWYLMRFVGKSPFSFSALDIKTYAMAVLGTTFRHTTKKRFPPAWSEGLAHTHVALDDALEQGAIFCNLLAENRRIRGGRQDDGAAPDPQGRR